MRKISQYRWIIELFFIILIFFSIRLWTQRDVISGTAPNIRAVMLNGKYFDLYQQVERPVLVHFWATWCPVCKLEQSSIENISNDYSVVSLAMQSGSDFELRQFMQEEKLNFNVINDEAGQWSQKYHIRGVPASFIISKSNKIEFFEVGYTSEMGLRARLWWAGL